MQQANWKSRLLGTAVLALALASPAAWGTLISFEGSGTGGDGAVSARADFNITNGNLTVTLTNLLAVADIVSIGQALSDISFDLSNDIGTLVSSSASGQFGDVDVGSGGTVTFRADDAQTGDTTPARFLTSSNTSISGTHITLEALGGGQPSQLILPAVPNGGAFPNANSSIEVHNSNTIGPATFSLDLTGVTANTTISNVIFSFGTSIGETTVPGVPVPTPGVPEPGTLVLLAVGLLGFVAAKRGWHRR